MEASTLHSPQCNNSLTWVRPREREGLPPLSPHATNLSSSLHPTSKQARGRQQGARKRTHTHTTPRTYPHGHTHSPFSCLVWFHSKKNKKKRRERESHRHIISLSTANVVQTAHTLTRTHTAASHLGVTTETHSASTPRRTSRAFGVLGEWVFFYFFSTLRDEECFLCGEEGWYCRQHDARWHQSFFLWGHRVPAGRRTAARLLPFAQCGSLFTTLSN